MMVLTPGSKARLLKKLTDLIARVEADNERETIMWYTAELMPCVVSELNYMQFVEPKKKRP